MESPTLGIFFLLHLKKKKQNGMPFKSKDHRSKNSIAETKQNKWKKSLIPKSKYFSADTKLNK